MSTPYDLDDDDANLPLGDEEVAQGPSPQKVESSQPEDLMAQKLAPVRVGLETPVAALEEERREMEAAGTFYPQAPGRSW